MKEKIAPITVESANKMIIAYSIYQGYEKLIHDRVDYVINEIARIFGDEVDWWDWQNGGGEIQGHFTPDIIKENCIKLDGRRKRVLKEWVAFIKDKNGKLAWEWDFSYFEFPVRFLYENFEEELRGGIQKYKEHQEKEKEIIQQKKLKKIENKQKLIESAKAKLTKEELSALKVKL
jgi:hypothetical protein